MAAVELALREHLAMTQLVEIAVDLKAVLVLEPLWQLVLLPLRR